MNLREGDVIFAKRNRLHVKNLYRHYGVYIGNGRVIHFTGLKGHETDAHLASIQETSLAAFLSGDEGAVAEDLFRSFSRKEVVRRAKSFVGKGLGTYNLMFNNCEHFARWCATGVYLSTQVNKVASFLLGANGQFLIACAANRIARNRWDKAAA